MKFVVIVLVAILGVAYFNDPKSIQPWGDAVGEAGKATAKVVKTAGEGTAEMIHKAARDDDTAVDKARNAVEDTVSDIKSKL